MGRLGALLRFILGVFLVSLDYLSTQPAPCVECRVSNNAMWIGKTSNVPVDSAIEGILGVMKITGGIEGTVYNLAQRKTLFR